MIRKHPREKINQSWINASLQTVHRPPMGTLLIESSSMDTLVSLLHDAPHG